MFLLQIALLKYFLLNLNIKEIQKNQEQIREVGISLCGPVCLSYYYSQNTVPCVDFSTMVWTWMSLGNLINF